MTQQEFKAKIDRIKDMIAKETAKNKTEEQFQELFALGIDVLGDLLLDLKRIANRNS